MTIAVVGTGGMGANHLEALKSIDGLTLCAVVDTNFEAAKKYAKEFNCKAFRTLDELLSDDLPDAVAVCVPSHLHYEYTMKCLDRGIHVFCEKPMAHSREEADKMIAKAKEKGLELMVGQVLRYWPEYQFLRKHIENGIYGRLRHLSLTRYYGMHPEGSWYMDPEQCKMVCFEMHIHDTDMVNYLFGVPDAVHSVGMEQPDIHLSYINTHYIYNNKDISVVAEGGWNDSSFPWSGGYIAVFEHGLIEYKSGRVAVYPAGGDVFYPKMELLSDTPSEIDGLFLELTDFVAILNGDKDVEGVTPESARDTIYIVEKECESLQKKAVVAL